MTEVITAYGEFGQSLSVLGTLLPDDAA